MVVYRSTKHEILRHILVYVVPALHSETKITLSGSFQFLWFVYPAYVNLLIDSFGVLNFILARLPAYRQAGLRIKFL